MEFKRLKADFETKQSERQQDMIAKQAERRLKQAFKGTVKPFRLAREKVNESYQSPILSKYEKLATKDALKFSIEDIYRMPAMEESNIGRA